MSFSYFAEHLMTPVGAMTLAANGEALVGAWFDGQKHFGGVYEGGFANGGNAPVLKKAKAWLQAYFAGERPAPGELPLAPEGSTFRRKVWRMLLEIPYGQCVTYGSMAKRIVAENNLPSMSGQAVGGAVGHNPISIIIPCHRVIGARGNLTGYAGGIALKLKLLELEGVDVSCLTAPKEGCHR